MKLIIDIPDEQYEYIKKSDKNTFAAVSSKECMLYAIKNGTPVSTDGDLISRSELKKAIEKGEGFSWDSLGKDDLCVRKKYIDNAQSVDVKGEKIIRCIDCKYYHPFKHWCDCHEDWAGGEDGFCSLAEMKDGDNE